MGFMTSKKAVSFVLIVCFNVNERIEKQKQNCGHGTKRREGLFRIFYYTQGRYQMEATKRPKKATSNYSPTERQQMAQRMPKEQQTQITSNITPNYP